MTEQQFINKIYPILLEMKNLLENIESYLHNEDLSLPAPRLNYEAIKDNLREMELLDEKLKQKRIEWEKQLCQEKQEQRDKQ